MLHTRRSEQLGGEVALQGVHLGHGVRDRRAGCKHGAATALGEIPGFHVHVERAVALGIGQSGDAVHLAHESKILEQIRLIDE